jgi:hypothetical protein
MHTVFFLYSDCATEFSCVSSEECVQFANKALRINELSTYASDRNPVHLVDRKKIESIMQRNGLMDEFLNHALAQETAEARHDARMLKMIEKARKKGEVSVVFAIYPDNMVDPVVARTVSLFDAEKDRIVGICPSRMDKGNDGVYEWFRKIPNSMVLNHAHAQERTNASLKDYNLAVVPQFGFCSKYAFVKK